MKKVGESASENAMKNAVVLGIGNRLMGDDGIGVRLAEALAQKNHYRNVRFVAGETDVDYCLNELTGAALCVILDASCSAAELCSVEVTDLKEIFAQKRPIASFHDFDLFHAMKRENMMKDGILITVEGCPPEFSEELSPQLRVRFDGIAEEVKERIDRYLIPGEAVCENKAAQSISRIF